MPLWLLPVLASAPRATQLMWGVRARVPVLCPGGGSEDRTPEDMELDAYTSGYDGMEDGCRSEWDNPLLVSLCGLPARSC